MTGLHAIHLSIGILAVAAVWLIAWRGGLRPGRVRSIELTALYWHFVDVIWVFLLGALYLSGG